MSTFSELLKQGRVATKHTQRTLADAVGVHYTYISKLECGKDTSCSSALLVLLEKELKLGQDVLHAALGRWPEDFTPTLKGLRAVRALAAIHTWLGPL